MLEHVLWIPRHATRSAKYPMITDTVTNRETASMTAACASRAGDVDALERELGERLQ
jgi:hypothetical protein